MPQGTAWWQEWVEGCHAKGRWKADINDPEVLGLCLCNPVTWISFATKRTLVRLRGVARYFFDLYNDMDVLDEEGVELHDLDDALDRALCEARDDSGERGR